MTLDRVRRRLLGALASAVASPLLAQSNAAALATRAIPASGEPLPVIGLGSWITFNVGRDPVARANCAQVMREFLAAGGRMIDSSPMYGSSQDVIGHGLTKLGARERVFSADKVWISGADRGLLRPPAVRWVVFEPLPDRGLEE